MGRKIGGPETCPAFIGLYRACPLRYSQNSFFCKILGYIPPKVVPTTFLYNHQVGLQIGKTIFHDFSKNPFLRTFLYSIIFAFTQFYAIVLLINDQKYFVWLSFRSFPTTMPIFSQIRDVKVPQVQIMVHSLVHPLLRFLWI